MGIAAKLLESGKNDIVGWTSDVLDNLAHHDSVKKVIAQSVPYRCLVAAVEYVQA
jgi:hypothetical protein